MDQCSARGGEAEVACGVSFVWKLVISPMASGKLRMVDPRGGDEHVASMLQSGMQSEAGSLLC